MTQHIWILNEEESTILLEQLEKYKHQEPLIYSLSDTTLCVVASDRECTYITEGKTTHISANHSFIRFEGEDKEVAIFSDRHIEDPTIKTKGVRFFINRNCLFLEKYKRSEPVKPIENPAEEPYLDRKRSCLNCAHVWYQSDAPFCSMDSLAMRDINSHGVDSPIVVGNKCEYYLEKSCFNCVRCEIELLADDWGNNAYWTGEWKCELFLNLPPRLPRPSEETPASIASKCPGYNYSSKTAQIYEDYIG